MSLSNLHVAAVLSCLFNSCPNLHELRIQVHNSNFPPECCFCSAEKHKTMCLLWIWYQDKEHLNTTGNYWESQNPSQCLINHLRIIQICGVNLSESYWIGFVKFLLMNAYACEKITIQYASDSCSRKTVEQMLKTFLWASPHAILEVKSSAWRKKNAISIKVSSAISCLMLPFSAKVEITLFIDIPHMYLNIFCILVSRGLTKPPFASVIPQALLQEKNKHGCNLVFLPLFLVRMKLRLQN